MVCDTPRVVVVFKLNSYPPCNDVIRSRGIFAFNVVDAFFVVFCTEHIFSLSVE